MLFEEFLVGFIHVYDSKLVDHGDSNSFSSIVPRIVVHYCIVYPFIVALLIILITILVTLGACNSALYNP